MIDPMIIAKILGVGAGVWLFCNTQRLVEWVEGWQHEELRTAAKEHTQDESGSDSRG